MRKILLAIAAAVALGSPAGQAGGGYELLAFDGHLVKWGEPRAGAGATVSYALATGPMRFPEARNCRSIVPVDAMLARSGITVAAFRRELGHAVAQWEAVAGIRFVATDDPGTADIVIGAQAEPRGIAFANVTFDTRATDPVWRLERAQVCLNPARPWKIGFGGDPAVYDLRYTLTHELGHTLGLDHPGPSGQLMAFEYHEDFRALQPGDIAGAVVLYGPRAPSVRMADGPADAPAARATRPADAPADHALR